MTNATTTPLYLRKKIERGQTKISWLESYHTFSFGDYYDPANRGFGPLRVINEDYVGEGKGFQTHPHSNMEIITYVLSGALEHRDSLGNGSVIVPGEIQKMSAGTGIEHSEFNPSPTEPVHLLQIWIIPSEKNVTPSYDQKKLVNFDLMGEWQLLCSPEKNEETIHLYQDAYLYVGFIGAGKTLSYPAKPERKLWLQVASGTVELEGHHCVLEAGDGVGLTGPQVETVLKNIEPVDAAQILLFDMAN